MFFKRTAKHTKDFAKNAENNLSTLGALCVNFAPSAVKCIFKKAAKQTKDFAKERKAQPQRTLRLNVFKGYEKLRKRLLKYIYCMFVCVNGTIVSVDDLNFRDVKSALQDRAGCFETMRLMHGVIPLWRLHYQRLTASLQKLQFPIARLPDASFLHDNIIQLAVSNGCSETARVRLSFFLGAEGSVEYLIETTAADPVSFAETSAAAVLYTREKKQSGAFSFIKSNQHLLYIMAGLYAEQQGAMHALILNEYNRVVESHLGNLFIVKDGVVKTPPLSEGCIAGVMRRYLMERELLSHPLEEAPLHVDDITSADEVFLTNAFRFIMPVTYFNGGAYATDFSKALFAKVQQLLY